MSDHDDDRRRPTQPALRQPTSPVELRAVVGDKLVHQRGIVVSLSDRTLVVDVGDASAALALTLAPRIEVDVDFGGGEQTYTAEPGRRSGDITDPHTIELVLRRRR